jgi:hypothetical protein
MKHKIVIVLLLSVFVVSCWRPAGDCFYLTDVDKQMIPYELGKTVNFIDSIGQPFVLTVTHNNIYWGPEPVEKYDTKYECINVSLSNDTKFYISFLIIGYEGYTGSWSIPRYITIHISYPNCYIDFELRYNTEGHFITDFTYYSYKQYFHNIFEINNKTYYDVIECVKIDYCSDYDRIWWEKLMPLRIFYNKTEGLLQFEGKDKVLFTIDNKDN